MFRSWIISVLQTDYQAVCFHYSSHFPLNLDFREIKEVYIFFFFLPEKNIAGQGLSFSVNRNLVYRYLAGLLGWGMGPSQVFNLHVTT
jgi:hypothetical protein